MSSHDTLIVVADHSAEVYAEELVRHFSTLAPQWHFFGVGGDLMADAGVELLEHSRKIGVVGIFEVFSTLPRLKALQGRILRECEKREVKNAILVDYPDFNLRLAKKLWAMGIRVYYYISPTVWAWRPGRMEWIRRYVHHLFLIFPFEEALYKTAGITKISYAGHPLLPRIISTLTSEAFRMQTGLATESRLLAILPGSRIGEVKRHLPVMLESLKRITHLELQPIILKADSIPISLIQDLLGPLNGQFTIVPQDQGHNLISASHIVLSSCGTATLEIALLGTPFVVVYRVNPLSYLLGRGLMHIKHFSIVNILAGHELVPELIQNQMTPKRIAAALEHLCNCKSARKEQMAGFSNLIKCLDPDLKPADHILQTILGEQSRQRPSEKGESS